MISLLFIEHFVAIAAFEARILAEVITFLLQQTPIWAIIMSMMWIGFYSIKDGMGSLARLFEIIFPITILFFLTVVFMSFGIFELDNLRPVLGKGIMPALKGTKATTLSFISAEVMVFLLAFMKKPKDGIKVVVMGIGIAMLFYLTTIVFVIGGLSVDGVTAMTWPTLDLIRSFEMPGLIFERFESLLLVIWIMQLFATFPSHITLHPWGSRKFSRKEQTDHVRSAPGDVFARDDAKNIDDVFSLGDMIGYIAAVLFGIVPIPLLLVSKMRKRRQCKARGSAGFVHFLLRSLSPCHSA